MQASRGLNNVRSPCMRGPCRMPSTVLRKVCVSVAAPEARSPMKMKKDKKDKCAKDALYLFQWHRPAQGAVDARQLCDELKTLEKVSKDAVWFTVKEAPTGGQHVLVVTADSKTARKYSLTELTESVVSIALEGMPEPVEVPVATLKESLKVMMDEDSSSDSSEDDEPMTMQPKHKEMKDKKKKKMKDGPMAMPVTVEEGPHAAAQAASLMQAILSGGIGQEETVLLQEMAKQERRKLKDAVKEVDAMPQAGTLPVTAMGDDDSSSSGSSSCSEEEEERGKGMTGVKMEVGKKGEEESSESSGSESDEECGKGKVEMAVKPVAAA